MDPALIAGTYKAVNTYAAVYAPARAVAIGAIIVHAIALAVRWPLR